MKISYLFLVLVSFTLNAASPLEKLKLFKVKKGPGIAFVVLENGVVKESGAYGYADVAKKKPITLKSQFVVASLSKQFTGMALLLLEQEKKINRDDFLSVYFEGLPKSMANIRVRHLVSHQSGLASYDELCTSSKTPVTNTEVMAFLMKNKEGLFPPGTKHQYSNSGYVVLAEVIAKASGMSFEKFVTDKIFIPLGMKHTELVTVANEPKYLKQMHSYTTWPFLELDDKNVCNYKHGPGSVVTSIEDYILWMKALSGNKFISEEVKKLYFAPANLDNGTKTNYAYGFVNEHYRNQDMIWHNGSWLSYRTYVGYLPAKNIWVAFFSNYGGIDPTMLGDEILLSSESSHKKN